MSEPDEAMVEAVAAAVHRSRWHYNSIEPPYPSDVRIARAVLSVPVVRDALARDAQVREIVDTERPTGFTSYVWAGERHRRIAALYPSPGDGWGVWGEDDIPAPALGRAVAAVHATEIPLPMPRIAYTFRTRFAGAVCPGCEQAVDVGDDAIQWTDDAITHKFCPRPPIVEIEEQR